LVGVLVDVLRGDRVERLVGRERVGQRAAAVDVAGRRRRQTAGVRRDRPVLVAGLLSAERRQRGAELPGFFFADGRGGGGGRRQAHREHRHRDGDLVDGTHESCLLSWSNIVI